MSSSREPALQNIPIQSELARDIRRGFIDKHEPLVAGRYDELERRILRRLIYGR